MAKRIALVAAIAFIPLASTQSSYANSSLSWQSLPGSLYTPPTTPWAYAPDASWPPTTIGTPLEPQAPDDELLQMLSEIDPNRIKHIVSTLANFGTRHTLSTQNSSTSGIGAARDWILKEMTAQASPDMTVELNSYIQGVAERISFPVNISNIVASIPGTDDPNRVYVVTGHYDSRRLDVMDYTNPSPGADDDATGVAVVMEMARVVALHGKPKASMIFAATAGEEQASYGATHLAKTLKKEGRNVEGNWNNDIVGTGRNEPFAAINDYTVRLFGASIFYPNASTSEEQTEAGLIGAWNDSPAQNLGRYIAEIAAGAAEAVGMQVALIYRPDRFLRGGDHLSFLEEGWPAVRFTEAVEDFRHQHQVSILGTENAASSVFNCLRYIADVERNLGPTGAEWHPIRRPNPIRRLRRK